MIRAAGHSFRVTPKQAISIQRELSREVERDSRFSGPRLIAGADAAYERHAGIGGRMYGGVVLLSYPGLEPVESVLVEDELRFPYVPGLLSFREIPALLKAFAGLKRKPDVALFDGQGIAHQRRIGIASHMGVLLDLPSIGAAKSRLCGTYEEPGPHKGDFSHLRDHGEIIGSVLRTRSNVKPLFVSTGHRVNLENAMEIVLACCVRFRIAEPIRHAHRLVNGAL